MAKPALTWCRSAQWPSPGRSWGRAEGRGVIPFLACGPARVPLSLVNCTCGARFPRVGYKAPPVHQIKALQR